LIEYHVEPDQVGQVWEIGKGHYAAIVEGEHLQIPIFLQFIFDFIRKLAKPD